MTIGKSSVLFIVADLGFFFSHRLALAHAACAEGYDVMVAAPMAASSDKLRQEGFQGFDWRVDAGGLNPFREIVVVLTLWNIMRRAKPSIIQAIGVRSIVPAAVAGRFYISKPLVCLFTGLGYLFTGESRRARGIRHILKPVLKICFARKNLVLVFQNVDDHVLFVNDGYVRPDQTTLIRGSGVDTDFFVPNPEPEGEEKIVLFPARILGDKGAREFIEAARIIRGRNKNIRFQIAGERDPKNPTCLSETEISNAMISRCVTFLGHCGDMKKIYAESHIVCLPSYREGLPRALLEAAACGRAIVTTDVPGCREAVQNHKNGILVPAQNAVELAAAIELLAANDVLRQRFGQAGRQLVEENFSITQINRETLAVYARFLRADNPVK